MHVFPEVSLIKSKGVNFIKEPADWPGAPAGLTLLTLMASFGRSMPGSRLPGRYEGLPAARAWDLRLFLVNLED